MSAIPRNKKVYQLRTEFYEGPHDIVGSVTHAIWAALADEPEFRGLDPHRWASLNMALQNIFRGRLVYHPECGHLEQCRACLQTAGKDGREISSTDHVFLLELGKDLGKFIQTLCAVALRHLRDVVRLPPDESRWLEARLITAVESTMARYTFESEQCAACAVTQKPAERRIWAEVS